MTASAQMLVANRGPLEDLVGFEVVGRAARLVLIDGLNDEIDAVQVRWAAADEAFEAAGHDVGVTAEGVDHVEDANVFQAPHKSLMSMAPIDRFPNVNVTGYSVRPGPGDSANDRARSVEVGLIVELYVIAGPVGTGVGRVGDMLFCQTLVHRRVERTAEAVVATIGRSENLLGTVLPFGDPRGGIVSSSWTKKTPGGAEQTYVLHGARFQYALQRLSACYG